MGDGGRAPPPKAQTGRRCGLGGWAAHTVMRQTESSCLDPDAPWPPHSPPPDAHERRWRRKRKRVMGAVLSQQEYKRDGDVGWGDGWHTR